MITEGAQCAGDRVCVKISKYNFIGILHIVLSKFISQTP